MKLHGDKLFDEVCADVVIRFRGHDAYQGRAGALRAFRRRAPGFDTGDYETAFDRYCAVYDLAVKAITMFPSDHESGSRYAQFEDIDFGRCLAHMDQVLPGQGTDIKVQILHWVIFWHYLK